MSPTPPAIILAAGFGSRLGHDIPKCLVKFGDACIVDHQVTNFEKAGVEEIHMVVGFEADKVRAYVGERYPTVRFVENADYNDNNTGKSLLTGLKAVGDRAFIHVNGDVVFDHAVVQRVLERPQVSKVVVMQGRVGEEEIKYVLEDGRLMSLSKQTPGGDGEAVGINYFAAADVPLFRRALEYIGRNAYFERAIEHMLPYTDRPVECLSLGKLRAMEIDFPEDLEEARDLFTLT
jgi:choline kinase